ncbi:MAG: four helix bundle protein [Planctomycetota bacterium]|nr:four helix bundle protein [Planctomycetota bacterium]
MFRFEKLDVWEKSVAFADRVYVVTKAFPRDERFGLTSQMRRAAVSISSNIAEGSGRGSDKDFAHFLEIAYGSLMEVVSQSQVALHQSLLEQETRDALYQRAEELARMLSGLRNSLLRSSSSGSRPSTLDSGPPSGS